MGDFFGGMGYLFNLIFAFPIFNGLMLLYRLFGDFGLSIVILTLIIKLVLFPLTLQQLKSMKANQALQPRIQEIKKKYAKDQQAQMQATQALFKEYGINPMAGCLPLVIQMPVLYGLFNALNLVVHGTEGVSAAKALANLNSHLYPFVEHFRVFPNLDFSWFAWLKFLNPILHVNLPWTISLANPDPTHILPIVAALATFVQLRMSQARTNVATTNGKAAPSDPTQQTMKMMQYIMPVFTFVIGLSFAAGLALYWTVSSVFQAVQQYFVTGWGSLMPASKPVSKKDGSKTVTIVDADKAPEKRKGIEVVEETSEDEEDDDEKPGAIASQLRNGANGSSPNNRNGSTGQYQAPRRPRSSSASARRRGSSSSRSRR